MKQLRLAVRGIVRAPGFALTAILSFSFAISANTVVFGVLNALLLRPLPIAAPEQVFFLQRPEGPSHSFPIYREIRDRATLVSGAAAYRIVPIALQTGAGSQRMWGYLATGNYFDVLGVRPAMGRFFHAEEDVAVGNAPYAVISYSSWRSRFASDPAIVGRSVTLNGRPFTVLGVAPEGFRGTELFFVPEIWVPMMMQPHIEVNSWLDNRSTHNTSVVVRTAPGVTRLRAEEHLNVLGIELAREEGAQRPYRFSLAKPGLAGDLLRTPVEAFSWGLMLLAALVLLAACVNVSTLFVVRSMDRVREMGIKLALGAAGIRLAKELVLEVLILSACGGLAGLGLAYAALRTLTAWRIPLELPAQIDVSIDARVVLFAVFAAFASGLVAALAPLSRIWRTDPYASIRAAHSRMLPSRVPLRDALLALQVACCSILLTAGIVSIRGLAAAFATPVAMSLDEVTVAGFDLGLAGYDPSRAGAFQRRVHEALTAIPGVQSAAYGSSTPLFIDQSTTTLYAERPLDSSAPVSISASYYMASPDYFRTLGTRLLRGRDFTWQDGDGALRVAIVNETLARRLGRVDATGWRLRRGSNGALLEVVGIVEDGKYRNITEPARAAIFFPILQAGSLTTMVAVRSARSQDEMAQEIRRAVGELDADLPLYAVGGLDRALSYLFVPAWAAAVTLNAFAVLAAMLIATGVYGLASYTISRRTREISIRMAIGARPSQVLRAVMGRTGALLLAGAAAGIALGLAANRILASIVYQAAPYDPVVLVAAIAAVCAIAFAACWAPARRALRLDPVRALRDE